MARRAANPTVHVELVPASRSQEPILNNLLQLYAHDFSEFYDVELGEDGRFVYKNLPLYWSEPDRHPFLVKADGKLAGFVFVKRGSEISGNKAIWDIAEFFILRQYRRRGIGTEVAHKVWSRFPGLWEVRVLLSNVAAYDFWVRSINSFAAQAINPVRIEKDGDCWNLFSFQSKREG